MKVWNADQVTVPYEKECRNKILSELTKRDFRADVHIVFSLRLGSEELDVVVFGPGGMVVGELKEARALKGSMNGFWFKGNRVFAEKNPFQQVQRQRSKLVRDILEKGAQVFRGSLVKQASRFCKAGVVQVPVEKADIHGIDEPWWFFIGFDKFLDFALSEINKERKGFSVEHVPAWLELIGCQGKPCQYVLRDLDLASGPTPSTRKALDLKNQAKAEQTRIAGIEASEHLLVEAGPGAGKTHFLVLRAKHLYKNLAGDGWMAICTHTNAARNELQDRIEDEELAESVCFLGTIHQLAREISRRLRPSYDLKRVHDEKQTLRIFSRHSGLDESSCNEIVRSVGKGQLMEVEDGKRDAWTAFHKYLDSRGEATFHTLLLDATKQASRADKNLPTFVLVDEYQDVSPLQLDLLRALGEWGTKISVVGDSNQSIYCFAGSNPELVTEFPTVFFPCQRGSLTHNWRSSPKIVSLLPAFLPDDELEEKQIAIRSGCQGELLQKCFSTEIEQNEWVIDWLQKKFGSKSKSIREGQIAVLARSGGRSLQLMARSLEKAEIPFHLVTQDREVRESKVLQLLFASLQVVENTNDWNGIEQIICALELSDAVLEECESIMAVDSPDWKTLCNGPPPIPPRYEREWKELADYLTRLQELIAEGYEKHEFIEGVWDELVGKRIGMEEQRNQAEIQQMVEMIADWFRLNPEELLSTSRNAIQFEEDFQEKSGVYLSTIHKAKGLEWDSVVVLNLTKGIFPDFRSRTKRSLEEERRLLYVALSRARYNWIVCCPERVGNRKSAGPRSFAKEVGDVINRPPKRKGTK